MVLKGHEKRIPPLWEFILAHVPFLEGLVVEQGKNKAGFHLSLLFFFSSYPQFLKREESKILSSPALMSLLNSNLWEGAFSLKGYTAFSVDFQPQLFIPFQGSKTRVPPPAPEAHFSSQSTAQTRMGIP